MPDALVRLVKDLPLVSLPLWPQLESVSSTSCNTDSGSVHGKARASFDLLDTEVQVRLYLLL